MGETLASRAPPCDTKAVYRTSSVVQSLLVIVAPRAAIRHLAGFSSHPAPRFDTTEWALVHSAGSDPRALGDLCQTYWYPLYAYVRQFGHDAEDARDLTQSFFVELLERHDFAAVRRERGRFRSYLLGALRHFLLNQATRAGRRKRGGGAVIESFDVLDAERRLASEPVDRRTPETVYERRWALTILAVVLGRVRSDWDAAGQSYDFDQLKTALLGPPPEGYRAWAAQFGTTPGQARTAVHRLRGQFRAVFRQVVGETVLSEEAVEQEMADLLRALKVG